MESLDLPDGWRWRRLGSVTAPISEKVSPADAPDANYIGLEHIEAHSRRVLGRGSGRDVRSEKVAFRAGDLLYGKLRPYLNKVALPDFDGIASTDILVFQDTADLTVEYLARVMNSNAFVQFAHQSSAGMELPRTSWKSLSQFELAVPPLPEQRRIVQRLAAVEERRTTARDNLNRARGLLTNYRQAVLVAACSGRLTADWRLEHSEAPTVADALVRLGERLVKSRKKSAGDGPELDLPELPETYVLSTVRQASVLLEYGTSRKAASTSSGVPMLRMGNIQDGLLETSDLKYCPLDEEVQSLLLADGDLLFNRTNSPQLVGKSAVFHDPGTMTFASYLIRVRFASDVAEPDFVNYWLNSAWGRAWARGVKTDGVSQSNINGTKLGAMPLPLPPIDEQREIVRRVRELLRVSRNGLGQIDAASQHLDRVGQAILAKALRGKLAQAATADA
ncbi:Type-1 restriction enzyme EcoKI specificity protein [Arthrobacter sp. SO5]|uniref:restriction endonuclease subunit S n=1 Tax=Arthrobacter sp. SO5 TaxID=1897055 RepID=UPI001E62885B|nr:restriction endonuclease subunit S [Arthrobacter sp. SO5]MCB5275917.1 Type-1 restriction enzyme EcoKI specificity protein [Arthrobacter sp. SO5]